MIKPFEKMSITEQNEYLSKLDAGTHPDLVFEFTEEQEREMVENRLASDKYMVEEIKKYI